MPKMEDFTLENRDEKQILWQEGLKKCESITDGLGLGMDENIKECVVGLWMNGFPTAGSCGGHLNNEAGVELVRFPYVYIEEVNEPQYRFVGEKEVVQHIMQKHNLVKDDDIFKDDALANEYESLTHNIYNNGELEEYQNWFRLNMQTLEKVVVLIEEYNSIKSHPVLKLRGTYPGLRIEHISSEKTSSELKKA